MNNVLGFDIGGTKCAVILASCDDNSVDFLERRQIKTIGTYTEILTTLADIAEEILKPLMLN